MGGTDSYAYDINNAGQVVGTVSNRAFITGANGIGMIDLGTLGGTISRAKGINNFGQVVGHGWTAGDVSSHATVWNGTTATDLTPGVPGMSSYAEDINASGQVAGKSNLQLSTWDWRWRASVWNGTSVTVLDALPGTTHSEALAINDAGQIVGRSIIDPFSGHYHATLWSGTTPIDLGVDSGAYDINNAGQVVGSRNTSGGLGGSGTHATLWDGTTITDLGTLGGTYSEAWGINNSGQVVGVSLIAGDLSTHSFLFSNGVMTDLSMLASVTAAGWTFLSAQAINDNGQIVGYGKLNGVTQAFLLSDIAAVPEPETYALMLTGLGLMGFTRHRRKQDA